LPPARGRPQAGDSSRSTKALNRVINAEPQPQPRFFRECVGMSRDPRLLLRNCPLDDFAG
jgi:hypothetical protein